jgi:hypothetical protein
MEDLVRLMLSVMKRADKELVRLSIYGDKESIHTMYELKALINLGETILEKNKNK